MRKKKGIPKLKIRARIASKTMEKDLIGKAKLLMDDPGLILPECAEDCGSCPFRKTRAQLEKIARFKDDPAKLAKLARRGDKLARAYAATIGLVHEEKTPYLATAQYPVGIVTYAMRGKTTKEKLIGVQNFDSPKWRVLSVLDLVQKKGLHFYSYGDRFVCTGRVARPPEDYVRSAAESIGASRIEGESHTCPHSPSETNHVEFDWISAGKRILVCDQCAAKARNSLKKLGEGMAVPRVLDEFRISIRRPLKGVSGADECEDLLNAPVDDDLLGEYSEGKIGDKELIEKHVQQVRESLVGIDRRIFARGDRCFGSDVDAFVKDMSQDPLETKALKGLLSNIEHPVVVDPGDSVNKLLASYWSDHGRDALRAVVSDQLADKYYRDGELGDSSPIRIIRLASRQAGLDEAAARIPSYTGLSAYGEFADMVARTYKTEGQAATVAVLDGEKSPDHRIRSMANAFYLAMGIGTKSWKYTDEEKAYGEHLEPYAKRLLESASPDDHHRAFVEFLQEAGSVEEIKRA
jgi:hypothetical protein